MRGEMEGCSGGWGQWLRVFGVVVDCIMHLCTLYVLSDAFFDFMGSLEIYFDFLGIFDGLQIFLPTLSTCPHWFGKFLKSVWLSGQIWVNLGPLCPDKFGVSRGQGSSPIIRGPLWPYSQHAQLMDAKIQWLIVCSQKRPQKMKELTLRTTRQP